jgi:hypothetical protein
VIPDMLVVWHVSCDRMRFVLCESCVMSAPKPCSIDELRPLHSPALPSAGSSQSPYTLSWVAAICSNTCIKTCKSRLNACMQVGFTDSDWWEQVMSQLSAARAIPPHNLEATTAEEAYKIDEVLSEADREYLDSDTLKQALQNPRKVQSLRAAGAWMRLNSVVRLVVQGKAGPGLLDIEAEECSKWLALLQVCCGVFKLRDRTEFDESGSDLVPVEGAGVPRGARCALQVDLLDTCVHVSTRAHRPFCAVSMYSIWKLLEATATDTRCGYETRIVLFRTNFNA